MPEFSAEHDVVHLMEDAECRQFLSRHAFGRLAYTLAREVQIVPINYVLDGEAIYFRTAEGSKLLGVTMDADVAFEVDDFGPEGSGGLGDGSASSVIVRGRAEVLEGPVKARAEQLPLRPWVPTQKHVIVRIAVTQISGRRFDLAKPWTHMRG